MSQLGKMKCFCSKLRCEEQKRVASRRRVKMHTHPEKATSTFGSVGSLVFPLSLAFVACALLFCSFVCLFTVINLILFVNANLNIVSILFIAT
jgi:hypothetical protein